MLVNENYFNIFHEKSWSLNKTFKSRVKIPQKLWVKLIKLGVKILKSFKKIIILNWHDHCKPSSENFAWIMMSKFIWHQPRMKIFSEIKNMMVSKPSEYAWPIAILRFEQIHTNIY